MPKSTWEYIASKVPIQELEEIERVIGKKIIERNKVI
jgi:hypothetical protein